VDAAHKRFESLRDSVKNANTLSKEELSHSMYVLGEIQQLLNVYDTLDSIKSLYVREGHKATEDVMANLADAIDKKDLMIEDFKSFALTYLTEWLYPYVEPTNKILEAQGYKDKIISQNQFREQLKTALRDISAAGYWLGATINSQDPISAAIGLALKDIIYSNHVKDLEIKKNLEGAYEEVKGTPVFTQQKDEDAFNLQFLREAEQYEKIGEEEDGTDIYGYVKRLAFHTEYLDDQYDKERREFYKKLGPRPDRKEKAAYKKWQASVADWYTRNTQVNPDASKIIANKHATLTKRQFDRWILENTKELDEDYYQSGMTKSDFFRGKIFSRNDNKGTFRIYSGELIRPADRYKNNQFNVMMKNPYYRSLHNTYKDANSKLGHFGLRYGIVPQVSKGKGLFSDLSWNKGVKGNLKQLVTNAGKSVKAEFDESRAIQRQDGTEVKHVPIGFTRMLQGNDLVLNLLHSTLKFSQMANNYDSMTEIEPNILILKTILNGDLNLGIKGREIAKTNSKGKQVINAITKKVVPKQSQENMLNARLNEFINDVVYGDEHFLDTINLLGHEISINKIANKVGLLTTLQTMAVNLTGGINNVIIGNFNNSVEAMGGRYWGKKDWAWAHVEYFKKYAFLYRRNCWCYKIRS
jgi:hypothetical protein